ncbi:hypothetical protein LX99_00204 [Mucilaginibacter oryzae]|uniref:Glycoside hydrolase n=1 Tax=Mucilaginibacter oryzae TaxID=468058 RepID=A0A316HEX4_9SPHI|nr:hypothetical protein [Mucilaginibacter oryzae]PWK79744.1 hypothetical protein LX99_00204 [Mucilaginibacter oryzae]
MKKEFLIVCAFVAITAFSFISMANINGKWTGALKLPDDSDFPLSYTFKVDSGRLTGTAHAPQGDVTITDGMINGDNFSFSIPVPGGTSPHTGKVYQDSLSMNLVYKGQHLHATLVRSN